MGRKCGKMGGERECADFVRLGGGEMGRWDGIHILSMILHYDITHYYKINYKLQLFVIYVLFSFSNYIMLLQINAEGHWLFTFRIYILVV